MQYNVYIIFSKKLNKYYVGTTDDFDKRLEEHNTGGHDEAFTKAGIHWERFVVIENLSSKQAYRIEKHIKKMKSAEYIANLKKYPEMVLRLIERYKD